MIKKLMLIKTGDSGTYYYENGELKHGVHKKINGNVVQVTVSLVHTFVHIY